MKVDLRKGVIPISKAASSLAQQIKRVQETGEPVAITQKGYPQAVLLDVYVFHDLIEELERLRARVAELEGGAQ